MYFNYVSILVVGRGNKFTSFRLILMTKNRLCDPSCRPRRAWGGRVHAFPQTGKISLKATCARGSVAVVSALRNNDSGDLLASHAGQRIQVKKEKISLVG